MPASVVGGEFPSFSVLPVFAYGVPLLNTVILLSSGVSVTWAHKKVVVGGSVATSVFFTVCLGVIFLIVQFKEYCISGFSFSDSRFGSVFFILTGFHGFHVVVGVVFLSFSFFLFLMVSDYRHIGFQCSVWY